MAPTKKKSVRLRENPPRPLKRRLPKTRPPDQRTDTAASTSSLSGQPFHADEAIVLELDRQGRVREINRKGCAVLGVRRAEVIGQDWFGVYLPKQLSRPGKRFFRQMLTEQIDLQAYYENEILAGDGERRYISWHNTLLKDPAGKVVGTRSFGQDLTEKKRVEKALRDSEQAFRGLVETALVGIYKTNVGGAFLYCNEALARMLGYRSAASLARLGARACNWDPADRPPFLAALKRTGQVVGYEVDFRTRDGRLKNVLLSAQLNGTELSGMIMDITELRQAQDKLLEQYEFLNTVLNSLAHPFYVVDARDDTVKMANRAARETPFAQMCCCHRIRAGKLVRSHRATKDCPLRLVQRTGQAVIMEQAYTDSQGRNRLSEVHAYPVFNKLGELSLIIQYSYDITDRQEAQQKIRDLAKFPSEDPSPVMRISTQGKILYANVVSWGLLERYQRDMSRPLPQQWLSLVRDTLASGENQQFDMAIQDKVYTMIFVPVRESGYVNIYGMEITARKQAEEELRDSEQRYAPAQRAANIGNWDWDIASGRIIWSETMEPLFGLPAGGFDGSYQGFLDCVYAEDRDRISQAVEECLRRGQEYDQEYRVVWPSGEIRWIRAIGSVLHQGRRPQRMLGIVQDITPRKRAEEVLRRDKETFEGLVVERTSQLLSAQQELERARHLSDLGGLAARVAHELRNPLGIIAAAAYNIQRKRINPDIDSNLLNIQKYVAESDRIIGNLLNYSRLKMPQFERVNIAALVSNCLDEGRGYFPLQEVTIVRRLSALQGLWIDADPGQINEIIQNILANAYQALEGRIGLITVLARRRSADRLQISFADNGPGMTDDDLRRIYEPFFTRKAKGTGLGLPICRELMALHNGEILVTSRLNRGTTVTLIFPIRNAGRAASGEGPTREGALDFIG